MFVGTGVYVEVGEGNDVGDVVEVGIAVFSTTTSIIVGVEVIARVYGGSGCKVFVSVALGVYVTGNIRGVDSAGLKGIIFEKAPGWNQPCIRAKPTAMMKSRLRNRSHAFENLFFGFSLFLPDGETFSTRKDF